MDSIIDKLAVIFHGIVGGMGGRNGLGVPIDLDICAKLINYNILSHYEHDIFIHSWSEDHKDSILSLYNPKKFLFQPQEMFGYSFNEKIYKNELYTHEFRTVSRYNSLQRAVNLKKEYELENNFQYKWVLVLRFDLVFFTKLELNKLDNSCFYICYEPHWPDIHKLGVVHDVLFLTNSSIINKYSIIADEIKDKKYNDTLHAAHVIAYRKLKEMFNVNMDSIVRYGFKRYDDVEIYRFVIDPIQNSVGYPYGALQTKDRLFSLLKLIGNVS